MTDHSALIGPRYISHYVVSSWGVSILIMEKSGKAFARLYRYNDDPNTVYLDCLSVDENARRHGVGTELQEIRENIGRSMGANISCLWVEKDTWMHDWYKKRGYKDLRDNENEEGAIWMEKSLVDNTNY
ncbi:MAG: GNAT family N-acetyltransferase [Bacteroidales bacterium]|nr:GNAT family N-acetyltransferase [Bacteroidales bacterium]